MSQPVEIVRDRWGVNHIYAKNEADLFFAQGYAAAKDRLFQFEVWRRQATGTVAEILGPRELKRDLGARLHLFRGDLDAELNHYHPRGKAIVEAFVRGVNAYIGETERTPSLLPIEFTMLGIKPGRWTAAVVISRHQALTANLTDEVRYLRAMAASGQPAVRELLYFQGGEPNFTPDPAIDPKLLPANVLELYSASRATVAFRPEDVGAEYRATATPPPAAPPAGDRAAAEGADPRDIGSNNWVVAGSRTQSTYPIMANDPHRTIAAPSLRYWVHLVAPGWNVIGGGEPVLPGVSIGHNEYGAWGLTIFGGDNEDLYAYETNPANANEYRYRRRLGGDAGDQGRDSRQGRTAARRRAEVHAAWTGTLRRSREPSRLRASRGVARTRRRAVSGQPADGSGQELGGVPRATSYNHMPSENMVWADRSGTIGWQAAGIQPLRKNWSGLLPVPGDGRYEWDGFLPIAELPHEVNPPRGFIATANHYLFPNHYPNKAALHYTWADPYRAARITEILGSGRLFSVAETANVQNDDLSLPARALVPLLRDLSMASGPAVRARDLLMTWDHVMGKDSVAAGIYAMWQRRVLANTRERLLPDSLRAMAGTLVTTKRVIDWLHAPDGRFGEHPTRARDALLALSMDEAVAELTKRFGPDPAGWKYGRDGYHHALINHPLSVAVRPNFRARLSVGPLPRGGDGSTISATGNGDNQTSGGSLKIIADTEDWDNSVGINTPGQSGNPDDPHYRDLFDLWARGKYFTLAYSRAKVDSVKESVTMLEPVATTQR